MLSMKKNTWARLKLLLLKLLLVAPSVSFGSAQAKSEFQITDFKYFRRIVHAGNQILLLKSSGNKNIHFLSQTNQMAQIKIKDEEQLIFKLHSEHEHFNLIYQNEKLNLTSKNKAIYFSDTQTAQSLCEQKRLNFINELDNVSAKIKEIKIEKLLDKQTCENIPTELIREKLRATFRQKRSSLTLCLENENVKNLFYDDLKFQSYIGSVFSNYLRLVDKISEDKNPLKIKCEMKDELKLGSFDETTNPITISLNYKELQKKYTDKDALSDAIENTLNHEIFHYGDQLEEQNRNNPDCHDEAYAKIFTNLCARESVVTNLPSSKEIDTKCSSNEKINLETKAGKTFDLGLTAKDGKLGTGTGTAALKQNNYYNNQPQLKEIKESDFVRVSDANLATLLSNVKPDVRNGEKYTVPAESSFGKAATATFKAFEKSSQVLTGKLNTVIAATTNPALANLSGTSKANIGATNTPRENLTASLPISSSTRVTETSNPRFASGTTAIPQNENVLGIAPNANTRLPAGELATDTAPTQKSVSAKSQSYEVAGSAPATASATSTSSPQAKPANNITTNTRSLASLPTTPQMPVQNQQDGAAMFKAIQSLKAFDTMTGSQYQEVRKYYDNPLFQNLLQTNDMRIEVKNGKENKIIGNELNQKTRKVFNDDGQILKAKTEVKK